MESNSVTSLTDLYQETFPCTAEKFFSLLLSDDSKFIAEYRSARRDTNLNVSFGQWHVADEYNGQVREITFRSLCHSPMCPPDTAMTEWQHAVLSSDKRILVFETVQQAHDVPFGSCFEVCTYTQKFNRFAQKCFVISGTLQVDIDNNLRVILSIGDTSW
ncbi:hypothetical protein ZIOFF_032537 [Zingiber officinale]|uniref:VASt domain-containing protein n=1 Tax=Zingiber officinale TaxID=94328 RepID=A0A8J5GJ56_ZINOF|nr:hypothetical protein ZIOFF_032537 [Zingiber officinale]